MKALILAAGRGMRMRPLTDTVPKPLLQVNGRSLIEHQIDKIRAAGVREIIINVAYLGRMIERQLGDGHHLGVRLSYSREVEALETGGALLHARALIGEGPLLLLNADVWSDIDLHALVARAQSAGVPAAGGHLVLVPNPPFKPKGDFALAQGQVQPVRATVPTYTFSGVSVLDMALVTTCPSRRRIFPLKEAFDWGIAQGRLSAQVHDGEWLDVGTPERLQALRASCR